MKVKVGVLFEALQLVESESHEAATKIGKGKVTKEFREISSIHAVLHKALKGCRWEVKIYKELDSLLVPFFEKYGLEIISG